MAHGQGFLIDVVADRQGIVRDVLKKMVPPHIAQLILGKTRCKIGGCVAPRAALQGDDALVTVRFISEQIQVTRDADGQIVDGNPNEVQKVVDLWTFRRDTKSSDPNWLLIKTESEG